MEMYGRRVITTDAVEITDGNVIEELNKAFWTMMESSVQPLIKKGLCAAVYTQISDIEEEVNGLWTYDRKVCKIYKKCLENENN